MVNSRKRAAGAAKRRILIVDEHPVVCEGLASLLSDEADLKVCCSAGAAAQAIKHIEACKPDLVVLGLSFNGGPRGLNLIKEFSSRCSRLRILVLSTYQEELFAERVLHAGAQGYIMKDEASPCILQAVRKVLAGQVYLSPKMKDRMLRKLTDPKSRLNGSAIELLSNRELEVFSLIGRGNGTRQIARELHVSVSTVETHRAKIKAKLLLDSGSLLVCQAVEWVRGHAEGKARRAELRAKPVDNAGRKPRVVS